MLLASLLIALAQNRTVPDVYEPGEQAVWVFEQKGAELGRAWSRYAGPRDLGGARSHLFEGCVKLSFGKVEQLHTCAVWTDDGGRPLAVDYRTSMSDARAGVHLERRAEGVHAEVRQGPTRRELDVEADPRAWILANNFIGHLELPLALASDLPVELDVLSVNALRTLEVRVELVEEGADTGERILRDTLGETLTLDRRGRLLRVEVPAAGLVIRRSNEAFEPFTITLPPLREPPADLAFEDVRILHGDVSLAGSLSRPKGAEGRLPGVFFVSGSGSQDRDGYSAGIDVGTHEILDRLTREGYAVLRVDDRGVGESTGPTVGLAYEDLVADARACVAWLRARPDVDPARVVVLGHSEGGMTAPILANELGDLAGIVLLAAPGRGIGELLVEQLAAGLRREGADEARVEELVEAVERFLAAVAADQPVDASTLPPELAPFAAERNWVASHLRRDPLAEIARVRCPVLLLQGARDLQVSVERDARPLEQALQQAGHPDSRLVVFPELDHLFKRTFEGSDALDYLQDRPVDDAMLATLCDWMNARLRPGAVHSGDGR